MPVLPAVASTTRPPGFRAPRFSASRIIHFPARSCADWPGFMNSALPRMVQPVASEACFSLIRGVLPIASTTSLLMVMSGESSPVCCQIWRDRSAHGAKVEGFCTAANSAGFGEHHLAHVDISGEKPRLAIGQVVFPQPAEPVIEAERLQVRPGRAEVISPGR